MKKISVLLTFLITISSCSIFDTEAPEITVTSPANEESIISPFLISGTASDNISLTKVEVRIDSGAYVSVEGLESWNYITTISTEGIHFITLKATDSGYNESFVYLEIDIIADVEEPEV